MFTTNTVWFKKREQSAEMKYVTLLQKTQCLQFWKYFHSHVLLELWK